MKIFLSHAAADGAVAEQVFLALRELGYDVFFDRSSLVAGEGFHEGIREQLVDSDLFVVLVSRNALRERSYCLTEIEFAEQRWPHPTGRVLPVLLEPLKAADLPAFLTAVTYLEPKGNIVAETAAATAVLARRIQRRMLARIAFPVAAIGLVAAIAAAVRHAAAETGPVRALSSSLRHRVRAACASNGPNGARLLLALADPPELVEYAARDSVRVLGKLDAEPVALASGEHMVAVATSSLTPIHLFRGEGLEPLPPLAIEFACDDCDQHVGELATRPVELAVFDDRAWVCTAEENRAPGFIEYTPELEDWSLPYYGQYSHEQLVEFGEWTRGARLRVINEHLWTVARDGDNTVLSFADQELAVFSEASDGDLGCARDVAQGPERALFVIDCNGELVRLTKDDFGDFERLSLGRVELPAQPSTIEIDHRIVCAPGRVLLTFTAHDGAHGGVALWTRLATWNAVDGVRVLQVVEDQEAVSAATTADHGIVVLRSLTGTCDALEVAY